MLNKASFPVRISSVNVTKSAGNCGFDHIYWRNPWWKISLFVKWMFLNLKIKCLLTIYESSHRRCSVIEGVLRNFAKFTGKHLYQSLFFNKVDSGKETRKRCFPVNFAKFLRTPFLQSTFGRLLLNMILLSKSVNS